MPANYQKLRDGTWGIKSTTPVAAGQTVTVTKRDGTSKSEVVRALIWTDGQTAWIAALQASGPAPAPPRSGSRYGRARKRACKTGGNCSSFGSGRSCGADDCDGF